MDADKKRKTQGDMDRRNIEKAMSERNLQPGDWEDRRSWRLGTGKRRTLWNRLCIAINSIVIT